MKFAIIGCNSEDAITFPHTSEVVTTPYGNARVIHATLPSGKEVDFLTRHSICIQEDAYETNFRANIFALYLCGVTHVISISVMGTCDYSFRLGSFCLITDFIDFTRFRGSSFRLEHRLVKHAGMDDVFDSRMTDALERVTLAEKIPYEGRVIYAAQDGPRYETAAEARMMRALDAQVIGSTLVPEAPLCREVCMKYASIGIIARYATGMDQDVTDEDLLRISAQHKGRALDVALKMIEKYSE
ncbi:MAG: MTAP family purine nucleoside phosphorylase [Clostridia bacterium]|nr:MTAP family purine nucleoside phosphorylase [Clostridia bacterium]